MKKISKLLLALSFALSITSSAFAVTVASWGGAYTESQKLGYGDPTAKALGIEINWVDYSGGLSEIKAQKEAGAITWDIIDLFAFDTINGCDEGLFVKFDFDKDFPAAPDGTPASEDFFTGMPSECAVGNILYSWNYAFDTRAFGGKEPKTIKDFFNTKRFPGKRAIYKSALTNLEIALAADGVKMGKGGELIYRKLEADGGVDRLWCKVASLVGFEASEPADLMGERKGVIPSERVYYLSEIAATVREYHQRNSEVVEKLRLCQHLETAAENAKSRKAKSVADDLQTQIDELNNWDSALR